MNVKEPVDIKKFIKNTPHRANYKISKELEKKSSGPDHFLETGIAPFVFDGHPIIGLNSSDAIIFDGKYGYMVYLSDLLASGEWDDQFERINDGPELVFATTIDNKFIFLRDGDGDDVDIENMNIGESQKVITISFSTLSLLFKGKLTAEAIAATKDAVAKGLIKVVDYSPDKLIKITSAKRSKIRQERIKAGLDTTFTDSDGFTLIKSGLHRPATVVLHDTKNNRYFLLSVDNSQYFGVELPEKVGTIKEAFKSLIPPQAKGKKVDRQGEWFFIPTPGFKVPLLEEVIRASAIELPRTRDANEHMLEGEIIIDKEGNIFAYDFNCEHDQHETISGGQSSWCQIVKNLAVQSFSMDGVD